MGFRYASAALLLGLSALARAEPPPVRAFARMPAIVSPALSPDGNTVAYIGSRSDADGRSEALLVTMDLRAEHPQPINILRNGVDAEFRMRGCGWASNERLLCGFGATLNDRGFTYAVSRLVGINRDGSKMKVLIQNGEGGRAQFQDRVLDWLPDDPDHVLIELDDDGDGLPTVVSLNIQNGSYRQRDRQLWPIRHFVTDGQGHVRIGSGYGDDQIYYFARLDGDREWRRLAKFKVFSESHAFEPLAVVPGTNKMYATGSYEGRDALWTIDLEDQEAPEVLARHPRVDINTPLFAASDNRLLGVYYETDKPAIYYTDSRADAIVRATGKLIPDHLISIEDSSRDEKVYLLRASNDVDAGRYYVFDTRRGGVLLELGAAYPELDPATLARVQPISYPARDGTRIPGYLTVPLGSDGKRLPLIVMPHGGPIARDSWDFDFLRAFLVSRGYAVLQMNFRGSAGFGDAWFAAAHQDWGGLTYDDITDGARWALAQGIADPQRMAIVGWSFGGYAALLGATRDAALYRCAVAIAGVSDLLALRATESHFTNGAIAREQLGHDRDKLRQDSPRRHVDGVTIPILLAHGTLDANVEYEQSDAMADALKKAGKPYEFLTFKKADHQIWRSEDRTRLLSAVETFLARHMAAASADAATASAPAAPLPPENH